MPKKKSKTNPQIAEKFMDHQVKPRHGVRLNSDGSGSSHLMRREYVKDRGWVAFPTLYQDQNGEWLDLGNQYGDNWQPILDYATNSGEVYDFGEDEQAAINFADNGSWKQQFARGGKFTDTLKLAGDTLLSTVGLSDVIGDENYTNQGFADASRVGEKIGQQAGQIAGNLILPGMGGNIVKTGQNLLGNVDGEDSERARIEQMRLNKDSYGKYSDSIGDMSKAVNPLVAGVGVAGTLGNVGATNFMQTGNVLGDLSGLKNSFGQGIFGKTASTSQNRVPLDLNNINVGQSVLDSNQGQSLLGADPFSNEMLVPGLAYGGKMKIRKKYQMGGEIKFSPEIKEGTPEYNEYLRKKQLFESQDPTEFEQYQQIYGPNFRNTGQSVEDFFTNDWNKAKSEWDTTSELNRRGMTNPYDFKDVNEYYGNRYGGKDKAFNLPIGATMYSAPATDMKNVDDARMGKQKFMGYGDGKTDYFWRYEDPASEYDVVPADVPMDVYPEMSRSNAMPEVRSFKSGNPQTTNVGDIYFQSPGGESIDGMNFLPTENYNPNYVNFVPNENFRPDRDYIQPMKFGDNRNIFEGVQPYRSESMPVDKMANPEISNIPANLPPVATSGRGIVKSLDPTTYNSMFTSSKFAFGGDMNMMPDGGKFVEYEGPTHGQGGINIDQNGMPTMNPNAAAEVEGNETMHDNGIEKYMFSARLVPQSELDKKNDKKKYSVKTYADLSKEINNKYKDADKDPIQKRSRDMELERLKAQQESDRAMLSQIEEDNGQQQDMMGMQDAFACGGKMKHQFGGPITPEEASENLRNRDSHAGGYNKAIYDKFDYIVKNQDPNNPYINPTDSTFEYYGGYYNDQLREFPLTANVMDTPFRLLPGELNKDDVNRILDEYKKQVKEEPLRANAKTKTSGPNKDRFQTGGTLNVDPSTYDYKEGNHYYDTTANTTDQPSLPKGVGIPGVSLPNLKSNQVPDLEGYDWATNNKSYKDLTPEQKNIVNNYMKLTNTAYRAKMDAIRTSHYEAPWYNMDTKEMNEGNAAMFTKLEQDANKYRKQYPGLDDWYFNNTTVKDGKVVFKDGVRAYGGKMKFFDGGTLPTMPYKYEEEFRLEGQPLPMAGLNTNEVQYDIFGNPFTAQPPGINEPTIVSPQQAMWDKINPTESLEGKKMPEGRKRFNPVPVKQGEAEKKQTEESQLPQERINPLGLASSMIGPAYDLFQSAQETPANDFGRVDPKTINLSEQRRELEKQAGLSRAIARENARNAPSAGGAMTNRVIANAIVNSQLGSGLSQSYQTEAAQNAQILNQAEFANHQTRIQEKLADQQDLALRKSTISQAMHNIGMNLQGYTRDLESARVGNLNNKLWFDAIKNGKYFDLQMDESTGSMMVVPKKTSKGKDNSNGDVVWMQTPDGKFTEVRKDKTS